MWNEVCDIYDCCVCDIYDCCGEWCFNNLFVISGTHMVCDIYDLLW